MKVTRHLSTSATVEAVELRLKGDEWSDEDRQALLDWLPEGSTYAREGDGRFVTINFPLKEGSTGRLTARHGDILFKRLDGTFGAMVKSDFETVFLPAYPVKAQLEQRADGDWTVTIVNSGNHEPLFVMSEGVKDKSHAVRITDSCFPGIEWEDAS